jgi:GNAT superfamily N-acetyltransferase
MRSSTTCRRDAAVLTIARAGLEDIPDVVRLLNDAARWLASRGIRQWEHEFAAEHVTGAIVNAEMWLVRDVDGRALGTMQLSPVADPAFWTADEAAGYQAMYLSRLATSRSPENAGLGALMLRWAADFARSLSYRELRLDCRRDNADLHRYYLDRGWTYLRTTEVPGRFSGALFSHPAAPDPAARAAFRKPRIGGWLDPGDRVEVAGHGPGVVDSLSPPPPESGLWEAIVHPEDDFAPLPGYWVRLDSGLTVLAERRDVRELCAS